VRGETIPVYGDGLNMREWIHVNDHVRGILKVLRFGKPREIYNLGSGFEISNIDLAVKILGILDLPQSRIEFVKDRPGHDLRYSLDFTKAGNELGFQCLEDFETGLGDTVRNFASQFK
jgi:dTDP-glucose 4,6-dehydratase